ncbi:MAG TPA: shikimate dehydrogenase [Vicinamibacterales bacterium]|nr:shikimate dehydrogenase [Vicinamibacterales bacterium]
MARTRLCVTVSAPTTAELRRRRDACPDADLVELRLDAVRDLDVAAALQGRPGPVVVTCRPRWEGGAFAGSEEERRRILAEALALGAEFVDVEWKAGFDDLVAQEGGRRIVISHHDFTGVPDDLSARLRAMRATGAAVTKLAVQAHRLADCLPLLDAGAAAGADGRLVLLAMGPAGFATRALAARFGSCWTYAGSEAGLGQIPAARLVSEFRFRESTPATAVYGLVGAPLAHSVSPAMHNAAFRAAGLDAVYVPLEAADADDFLQVADRLGVRGVSVTIPYKEALYARAGRTDPVARRVGAVNTLRREPDGWHATNTDVEGFLAPLAGRMALAGARVAVLGAGGAARAVAIAAAGAGAQVTVHARTAGRAEAVARLAGGTAGPCAPPPGSWDLLVNATPVGQFPHPDASPMRADSLTGRLVYDLVYNPATTRLLREAAAAGCRTLGGLEMLVAQARAQFAWWTGASPDARVMTMAAVTRLAEEAAVAEPA